MSNHWSDEAQHRRRDRRGGDDRRPEVVECHRMFGDPDYVIRVAVADVEVYERFLIDTFADLPGVARMTSQFAMKTIKAAGPLPFQA